MIPKEDFHSSEFVCSQKNSWVLAMGGCLLENSGLAAETVKRAALPLQGVDDIHRGNGLPLGVLGVGDGVADHVLQEHLKDATGLLVDEAGDSLNTTTTGQATNRWFGDSLNVVSQNFPVTLRSSLSQAFTTLTPSGHGVW